MKSLFRLGLTLAMVVSVYPATASASQCTSEQMQKMAHGGLSQQEITHICDTASPSALSLEEATEKLKAYAVKNSGLAVWYWIELPKPGNIELHDLNWYYQILRKEGYVTRWEADRANPKEIKLDLTEKGKRFVQTGKPPEAKYSLLCCNWSMFGIRVIFPYSVSCACHKEGFQF